MMPLPLACGLRCRLRAPPNSATDALRRPDERTWNWIDAGCIAGIVILALYYLTAFRFDTLFTMLDREVDFRFWYDFPARIAQTGRYPASVSGRWDYEHFPYLPSSAAAMLSLHALPRVAAFALWILAQGAALAAVLWASLRLSDAAALRERWIVALVAVLLLGSPIGWDFRNHNTNMIYLAVVMLGLMTRRTWLAALLFAASFNLKLYSALLPGVFVWRREIRLAAMTVVFAVLIFVLLPVAVFGPSGFPQLLADWYQQIAHSFSPAVQASIGANLIQSVAAWLALDPGAPEVTTWLRIIQAAWIVSVGGYFLLAARGAAGEGAPARQARLADVCVALIAPLPLSTWLIPYHTVVLLPAFILLIAVVIAPVWPAPIRIAAAAALVVYEALRFLRPEEHYRGAVYLVGFVFTLFALGLIRRQLAETVDSKL